MRAATAVIHLWLMAALAASAPAWAAGDAQRGARVFQACAACHSTVPGEHMTGPSLAKIWQHKAATVPGFPRYSDAIKGSDVTWNASTLDRWLANPAQFIPGTAMTFPGLRDAQSRADVIAYLEAVSAGKAAGVKQQGGGMMMGGGKVDLKKAPASGQVTHLAHCKDTYTVSTADGRVEKVWEFNLRLKTDSSALGPHAGKPVAVGAGMQGDRASIVFASPAEISAFIGPECPGAAQAPAASAK